MSSGTDPHHSYMRVAHQSNLRVHALAFAVQLEFGSHAICLAGLVLPRLASISMFAQCKGCHPITIHMLPCCCLV